MAGTTLRMPGLFTIKTDHTPTFWLARTPRGFPQFELTPASGYAIKNLPTVAQQMQATTFHSGRVRNLAGQAMAVEGASIRRTDNKITIILMQAIFSMSKQTFQVKPFARPQAALMLTQWITSLKA